MGGGPVCRAGWLSLAGRACSDALLSPPPLSCEVGKFTPGNNWGALYIRPLALLNTFLSFPPHLPIQKTSSTMSYKVADISLAAWGRREIELAEREMPGYVFF